MFLDELNKINRRKLERAIKEQSQVKSSTVKEKRD